MLVSLRQKICRQAARAAAVCALTALMACATPVERFEQRAAALDFASIRLQGAGFTHRAFVAGLQDRDAPLHVYIEHDGTPWAQFDRVSADPTPQKPFALELMAKDSGPRILLGRPCHFVRTDPHCNPLVWTHGRYSEEVVTSMAAALREFLSMHPYRRTILIGYSGGGTIAWLMAARLAEVTEVVTIAANLDIDDWARMHGYSRLDGSLNPATAPMLRAAIRQRHFVGGRDVNVPPSIFRSFARRHPNSTVTEIADFDHVCCWLARWPDLLERQGAR